MKDHLVIEENLTVDDINDIYYLIDQFGNWIDGSISYTGKEGIKKNNWKKSTRNSCISYFLTNAWKIF